MDKQEGYEQQEDEQNPPTLEEYLLEQTELSLKRAHRTVGDNPMWFSGYDSCMRDLKRHLAAYQKSWGSR